MRYSEPLFCTILDLRQVLNSFILTPSIPLIFFGNEADRVSPWYVILRIVFINVVSKSSIVACFLLVKAICHGVSLLCSGV